MTDGADKLYFHCLAANKTGCLNDGNLFTKLYTGCLDKTVCLGKYSRHVTRLTHVNIDRSASNCITADDLLRFYRRTDSTHKKSLIYFNLHTSMMNS